MLQESDLVAHLGASAAVLAYLELRVTRAVERQSYLLETRIYDRRRRPPRADSPRRRAGDRDRAAGGS